VQIYASEHLLLMAGSRRACTSIRAIWIRFVGGAEARVPSPISDEAEGVGKGEEQLLAGVAPKSAETTAPPHALRAIFQTLTRHPQR
jgi:hypothetical protein